MLRLARDTQHFIGAFAASDRPEIRICQDRSNQTTTANRRRFDHPAWLSSNRAVSTHPEVHRNKLRAQENLAFVVGRASHHNCQITLLAVHRYLSIAPLARLKYRRPSYAPACATATAAVFLNQGLTRRSSGRRPGTVVPAHLYVRRHTRSATALRAKFAVGYCKARAAFREAPQQRQSGSFLESSKPLARKLNGRCLSL